MIGTQQGIMELGWNHETRTRPYEWDGFFVVLGHSIVESRAHGMWSVKMSVWNDRWRKGVVNQCVK